MLQGFLIDPFRQVVEPVACEGSLSGIYRVIEVNAFAAVQVALGGEHLVLYVDEIGLMRKQRAFFMVANRVLTGRSLVLSLDASGDSVSARTTLELLSREVSWVSEKFAEGALAYGLQVALAQAVSRGMRVRRTEMGFVAFPLGG